MKRCFLDRSLLFRYIRNLRDAGLIVVADYSTSVRIFEALREKTENKTQYDAYVNELKPVREELGMSLHICSPGS